MGEQGVMMTMRVGKVVRRVVMTMRKGDEGDEERGEHDDEGFTR